MKFLIVGSGGRESAFALKLAEDSQVFAVMAHRNPTIIECVEQTDGAWCVGDANSPRAVADFAEGQGVDYIFVNADDPLANGVVDVLLARNLKAVGGTREATRIEWDKIWSIELMAQVAPEHTPFHRTVASGGEVDGALKAFRDRGLDVVVKPQGLTGGKGVKVMPEHLPDHAACAAYAAALLKDRPGERVLLVEKLDGIEFTVMGLTDGEHLVPAPATYDYPFRLEGDRGPGTGGMGCFTAAGGRLPFLSDRDMTDCREIMTRVIAEMKRRGLRFDGVLNGGFFRTREGIRFMEFNGRFGDPEALNVLSVLDSPFSELIVRMWDRTLDGRAVRFADKATVNKYLVAPEYPGPSPGRGAFAMDAGAMAQTGIEVFCSACERAEGDSYTTLGKSRAVALGAVADGVAEASARIDEAIERHVSGPLEHRRDIGSAGSLEKLARALAAMGGPRE